MARTEEDGLSLDRWKSRKEGGIQFRESRAWLVLSFRMLRIICVRYLIALIESVSIRHWVLDMGLYRSLSYGYGGIVNNTTHTCHED